MQRWMEFPAGFECLHVNCILDNVKLLSGTKTCCYGSDLEYLL